MTPTQTVLKIFEQLSAIPRRSGNEAAISRWLQERARAHGFAAPTDAAGNLVIRVPGTAGYESAPTVVLQGHMDMVCEKTPDSTHDFTRDPIRFIVEGDWLYADRTTLGADNGIALALALALAEDPLVAHPPLELLFTVNEEVGLSGAEALRPGFFSGKILLNLDSEDEGTFIVGCAGGQGAEIRLPLVLGSPSQDAALKLRVSGLQGGHSGIDIHKHRASANKLLGRALDHIRSEAPIGLMSLNGGTARNAIARDAEAAFTCDADRVPVIEGVIRKLERILRAEYATTDSGISLALAPVAPGRAATRSDTVKAIHLLTALPHGVAEMSATVEGFVETSNNLARIEIVDDALHIVTSQRSTVMSRMEELTARIVATGLLAGAESTTTPAYPGWEPDSGSPLLQRSVETYQTLFGVAPKVQMIHAGLECGLIGAIYGGLDMISLGATIRNPHSPNERLNIPSVGKVWDYLVAFLRASKQAHRS
jgi:dipeptidase D